MKPVGASELSVFVAIARHGSLRHAAVHLGVTPSSLSHALRTLEERIGFRLFNRTTRSVALTEVGRRLYDRVTPAFHDIDDAIEDLNAFRGKPLGTLRLNASHAPTRLVLLPLVAGFLRAYPGIQVDIVAEEALVDMVSAGFDAGVRFGENIAADMIAVPIGPEQRFAVVGSPEYFRKHPRPAAPHDLRHQPCVRFRFHSGIYYQWEFERDGVEVKVDVNGPLTLSDMDMMIEAAVGGVGLAYVFETQARELIAAGRLVRVLEGWCPAYPGFFLYYPSRSRLPAPLRAFVDFVKTAGTSTESAIPTLISEIS